MRSPPVAPVPVATDNKNSSTSTPASTSKSSNERLRRQQRTTQPQFLTGPPSRYGNSTLYSSGNPHPYDSLSLDSPPLTSSSISNEEEYHGEGVEVKYYSPESPILDRPHTDDVSHASTDDPYTYSDDSASLSDAYFMQQSPEVTHVKNADYLNLLPLASPDRDSAESRSQEEWSGPQSIQVEDEKLPPRRKDARAETRNSKKGRRWFRRRNRSPSVEENPVNENTLLLDARSPVKTKQRDQDYYTKHSPEFLEDLPADGAAAKSFVHRQHRKKHQLRKYKRQVLLLEQQKRQEERERAVSEVRGQPQPLSTKKDRFWLVLFLFQLFLVCAFAIRYGVTFYNPKVPSELELSSFPLHNDDDMNSIAMSSMLYFPDTGTEVPVVDQPFLAMVADDQLQVETEVAATVQVKPFTIDYKNVLSLLLISGMYASIISYLSFAFMLILARSIIPIMLVFTSFFMLCWGFFGAMVETRAGTIISLGGFVVFGMSFAYTMSKWNQIPLCSTNFHTAICAMRSSVGILLVGISLLFVGLVWLLIWTIALMGTFNRHNSVDCEVWDECETHVYIYRGRIIEIGFLMLSLYWTTMVIKNIVRVTVAGVIGGPWWFATSYGGAEGGQDQCCGCWPKSAVSDSLFRACTTSLGTICYGSLVEIPAQWLSKILGGVCWLSSSGDLKSDSGQTQMVESAVSSIRSLGSINTNDEENDGTIATVEGTETTGETENISLKSQKEAPSTVAMYFGMLKLKLQNLDRALQCCNRWSYTYIGMYNYSFYKGGEKALQLFETREWMDIARDTLIQNILLMASIVIGGSSGIVAVLVEEVDGYTFSSLHKPIMTSFLIGFFLGFILSNILLLGLAASAVNTVLVCFAAEPFAFDRNHPHLSREMREVWSQQVWEPNAGGV